MKSRVMIIAEAGVNHNGSLATAKKLVKAARDAGADAVKFQTFKTELMATADAPKAGYQLTRGRIESQYALLKSLELDEKAYRALAAYCRQSSVVFLSSAFDIPSRERLSGMRLRIFKVPSGEITNLPYLRSIGALRKKIILSTGMSTLKEISDALNILISSGTKKKNITVLHCTTEYPAPYHEVNLRAMVTIGRTLRVNYGYSDHTCGIEVPVAAAALGASVIEKHLTLDKKMKGPDHKASLEPHEFSEMVKAVRNVEKALGSGVKRPSKSEKVNMPIVRKSIVALRGIKKGEKFSETNMGVKRPGTGISPMKWDNVVGRIARRDFQKDDFITL